MRILFSFILAAAFLIWLVYRTFIKKDIKQHLNEVYLGLFFMGVWGLLYYWIFS